MSKYPWAYMGSGSCFCYGGPDDGARGLYTAAKDWFLPNLDRRVRISYRRIDGLLWVWVFPVKGEKGWEPLLKGKNRTSYVVCHDKPLPPRTYGGRSRAPKIDLSSMRVDDFMPMDHKPRDPGEAQDIVERLSRQIKDWVKAYGHGHAFVVRVREDQIGILRIR